MPDALKKADQILQQSVQGITELINVPALINLDFADVRTVMSDKGIAHIGIGSAKGDNKAIEAVQMAVNSPLLETTITGASHVIVNIFGEISIVEVDEAVSYVQELAGEDATIIFGADFDENFDDECRITVIATGLADVNRPKTLGSFGAMRTNTASGLKPIVTPTTTTQADGTRQINFNPVTPERTVKPNDIKVPEFLQRNRTK